MNKKMRIIATLLITVVLLFMTGIAAAEKKEYVRNVWDKFDIEFTMPEEYFMWEETDDNDNSIRYGIEIITPTDDVLEDTIAMSLTICNDDSMTEKTSMNDLTDEELEMLERTFPYAEDVGYFTSNEGQLFLTVEWKENEKRIQSYVTIYDSCMIELVAEKTSISGNQYINEDETELITDFLRSIRFTDDYLNLGDGWRINKQLTETSYSGSVHLYIDNMSEKYNTTFIPVCVIATDTDSKAEVYLLKNQDTGELVLVRNTREGNDPYEILETLSF